MEFPQLWTIFLLVLPVYSVGIRRYSTDLFENDVCGYDTSVYSGKCKKIKQCVNLLTQKKVIEICSFDGDTADETLVCCSREDFDLSKSLTGRNVLDFGTCMDKYKDFRSASNEDVSTFIVNGVDVNPGEFPHIVAIGWSGWTNFDVDWNCGGALVTEAFVLTAAHCTEFQGRIPNIVRIGDNDLKSPYDDTYAQQFEILNIISHPSYRATTTDHDIALIQLNGQVTPTRNAVPACVFDGFLPTNYFEAAGYGQDGTGLQTNKLSKVQLEHIPMETCQESFSNTLSSDSQMCAQGYRDDVAVQDTCYGDSGSPLQYYSNYTVDGLIYQIPTIVGLTSFGIGCGFNLPSVYTKVSNYIGWMESVIMP